MLLTTGNFTSADMEPLSTQHTSRKATKPPDTNATESIVSICISVVKINCTSQQKYQKHSIYKWFIIILYHWYCAASPSTTGRAWVQCSWDTVTEWRKQEEGKVVWSQLGQRIVCPLLPPPLPYKFTFKPSTSTQAPLLLKPVQKHTGLLSFLKPGALIRGKNETLNM